MPGGTLRTDFWIHEFITPWDYYAHGITDVLDYRKTRYQEMYIVATGRFGKALVLDGKWQSCTLDEFLYHEPLVHPAMLSHGAPRSVLILGGGEGATTREVFRWKSVQRVVMIDIDREVVEACKTHLAEMHEHSFDDPRLDVRIEDALGFLDRTGERFDVVLSDLSDPIDEGPSFRLFTKEYFEKARRVLTDDGVFVVQAGSVSPAELTMYARLAQTVSAVFGAVQPYWSFVPSYAAPWGFLLAAPAPVNHEVDPHDIDRRLAEGGVENLRMLDGAALQGLFRLPLHIRRAIDAETRVYTLVEPPKFFGKGSIQPVATPV